MLNPHKVLFADQGWLQVRVQQRGYTYDGYLDDLTLAWERAHSDARRQVEMEQKPVAFLDCLRYLLIRTSINSIIGNYSIALVARAVEIGIWDPQRALSLAVKISDRATQVRLCLALLQIQPQSTKKGEILNNWPLRRSRLLQMFGYGQTCLQIWYRIWRRKGAIIFSNKL